MQDVVAATRLSPRHVRAIDDGEFDRLPPGLYARAYVRAFATAVGAAPSAVDEVLPLLPTVADPLQAIEDVHARRCPDAWPAELVERCKSVAHSAMSQLPASMPSTPLAPALRVLLAALIDALLLLGANCVVVILCATILGMSERVLVQASPSALLVMCAMTWMLYFVLFAGIHGHTAGERMAGLPRRARTPLTLDGILHRAVGWRETSAGGPHAATRIPAHCE